MIQCEKAYEERIILQTVKDDYYKPLTDEEKKSVVDYWGIEPTSFREYEVFKYYNGFDVRFMPMSIYLPLITRRLNPYVFSEPLEHKSMFGYLTSGIVHYPKCFIRTINGEYYSSDMKQTTLDESILDCLNQDRLVIKDSVGGSGGHGIEILKLEGMSKEQKISIIKDAIEKRKRDFAVQEFLYECDELKQFNPTSVNTIRVQSLYLNGKWSAVTTVLRFGGEGAEVDNTCSGGVAVGIHPDGSLYEFGYDNQANQYTGKGKIVFKDTKLSFVPSLLKHVEQAHTIQYPIIKYIGWDFMVDVDGNFVCIEINSCQNGHLTFQLSAGPTFGNRTKEVIEYCNSKLFIYNKSLYKF